MDESEKKGRKVVLVGVLLIVAGLFLPWARWEIPDNTDEGATVVKGSVSGLETMDEKIDVWFILFFSFLAGYFALSKKGSLSSIFIVIFGFLVAGGVSLGIFAPWEYVPSEFSALASLPQYVDSGIGLYTDLIGGILILGSGIFSLIQKGRIGREASGPPPY